jgi:leader peptidase (prepilin peptidase)/N-methyltransferase
VGIDGLVLLSAGAVGLCLGSFLNVCILRLPGEQSLIRPPSSCPKCGKPIAWRDNIPVVSWLLLRGRCRHCHAPISMQYPIIEAAVGLIWIGAVVMYGATVQTLAGGLLGTILLGIAVTDARHYLIPDEYTVGGLVLGLGLSLSGGANGFVAALVGAAVGFG